MNFPEPYLISVIVPIYNAEKHLERCIDSIIDQTYRKLQIILVNDGSDDGSDSICKKYCSMDNRIIYIKKENGGVSSARNVGITAAKGDYFGFVDSDDYIVPNMFEVLISNASKYCSDISCCGYRRILSDKTVDYKPVNEITVLGRDEALEEVCRYRKLTNSLWNKIFRKDLFDDFSFPNGKVYEDVYAVWRLILKSSSVVCSPDILYSYYQNDGSISHIKSIKNSSNMWDAFYDRYCFTDENKYSFAECGIRDCLHAAWLTWVSLSNSDKKTRDSNSELIDEIKSFSRSVRKSDYKEKLDRVSRIKLDLTCGSSSVNMLAVRAFHFASSRIFNRQSLN